jgi:hypothetical protein
MMTRVDLVRAYGHREQELDVLELARHDLKSYTAQHHVRYSDATDELIKQFRLTPVVLTRNIFDVVVSVRDHLRNESYVGSMAWMTADLVKLPDPEVEEIIADHIAPWYIHFFVSWQHCAGALWVTYEEVRTNTEQVVAKIAKEAGIPATAGQISAAIQKARNQKTRFNKGISGRGENLSPRARAHIERLISRYPKVDFSMIFT